MGEELVFGKALPGRVALANSRDRLVAPMNPAGGAMTICTRDRLISPCNPSTRTQDRLPTPTRPQGSGTQRH